MQSQEPSWTMENVEEKRKAYLIMRLPVMEKEIFVEMADDQYLKIVKPLIRQSEQSLNGFREN